MRWRTMIAVFILQRSPGILAYYPVSPDQASAECTHSLNCPSGQPRLTLTELLAGPHPSAPRRSAEARP